MTNVAEDDADPLAIILHRLLPLLLAAALSVKTFVSRWRLVHSNLLRLQSLLSGSSCCHPLFVCLVRSLVPELSGLLSLSRRCLDPSLPDGKLHLQSDLDIASSTLALRLHDLGLLLLHSTSASSAIVLPVPSPSASRADVVLFVRDAFARLQIGGLDLKLDALQSLQDLLDSGAAAAAEIVAGEGATTAAVLRLLDHPVLRDRAAALTASLAAASAASRRAVFDEGGLGPLLRLLDPSLAAPAAARDRAAAAVAAFAADPASAWGVAAYGGVPILVAACRGDGSVSPSARALAAAALRNLAAADDARAAMVEEGAVPALADLVVSGTPDARRNAALCLLSLASATDDRIRSTLIQESALQRLLQSLVHDNSHNSSSSSSDQELQEIVLKAIQALSPHPACSRILRSSPQFFAQLADLVRRSGSVTAAALLGDLSPDDDAANRSLAPCMSALVRMMESSKPPTAQETAARALARLLSAKSNRRELARDEKSVMRLVQMLDPRNEDVAKRFPVSVVLAMTAGGGSGARKRLAEAGACQALQKLAAGGSDGDVAAGARKALQRISGNRFRNLFSIGWSN
ncbi:hypothetical protein ACMD2_26630 [Ananas comosus]|uniref:DUF7032 domain-containing protein n=1 Tax=Ananas comosus TaxID=4615 RepID=A0A199UP27_ANACO|nr:hypothetical protein ACMD2_26630 [Ananas comosus]